MNKFRKTVLLIAVILVHIIAASAEENNVENNEKSEGEKCGSQNSEGVEGEGESEKGGAGCGCAATNRQHPAPAEETSAAAAEAEDGDADVEAVEDETEEEEEASPAAKYTSAANAESPYPRTHQMVKIKGGKFMMGTDKPIIVPDGEGPARKVTVSSFWMDVHEVSNSEFELFVNSTGYVTEVCIYFSL